MLNSKFKTPVKRPGLLYEYSRFFIFWVSSWRIGVIRSLSKFLATLMVVSFKSLLMWSSSDSIHVIIWFNFRYRWLLQWALLTELGYKLSVGLCDSTKFRGLSCFFYFVRLFWSLIAKKKFCKRISLQKFSLFLWEMLSGLWATEENRWLPRTSCQRELWKVVVLVISCSFYVIKRWDKYNVEFNIPQVDRRVHYKGRIWDFASRFKGFPGTWNICTPVSYFKELAPPGCWQLSCDLCGQQAHNSPQAYLPWSYV